MPYRNPEYKRRYNHEYNKRNPRSYRDNPSRTARYALINETKQQCGCQNPACPWQGPLPSKLLDFHHKNPATKSFALSSYSGRSLQSIIKEINKCIVLCANCHRLLHAGLLDASSVPLCRVTE